MHVCPDCQRCYEDSALSCTEEDHTSLSQIRDGGPDLIPGYLLDVFVGRGSGVETYYGRHIESGESCIVTMRTAAEALVSQFRKEAELAVRFCHTNVVDVYDSGRLESGEVFVVSEDAEGDTLHDILATDGVPKLSMTITVIRQVAEALDALHASGLAHGSINSRNIILTGGTHQPLARIKDVDLGGMNTASLISSKFHDDDALYMFRYFAPEQCSGSGPSIRADIYSLGVLLYEMLAGEPPFNASKAAGLIDQHMNQRPPEVRIDDIDLRMLLTHTLSEALQKKPEMRQASANVFARQMRHIEQLATHSSLAPAPVVAQAPVSEFQPRSEQLAPAVGQRTPVAVNVKERSPAAPPRQAETDSAAPQRRSVQWEQPVDDIPSQADVLEALLAETGPAAPLATESPEHEMPETVFGMMEDPVVDDELGVVAADPNRPLAAIAIPVTVDAVPLDRGQLLFSSLDRASAGKRFYGLPSLRIAAAIVLLVAGAIGTYLIRGRDFGVPATHEHPQAQALIVHPAADSAVEADVETYPIPIETATADHAAPPSELVRVVEPNVPSSKNSRPTVRESSPAPEEKEIKDRKAPPELISKNVSRPMQPTIVITYGGEKPAPKIRLVSKPVTVSRPEGTRPRIVKNPKP